MIWAQKKKSEWTHLGSSSAHVSHHSPSDTRLKDVGGCKVKHLSQSHLWKQCDTCFKQFHINEIVKNGEWDKSLYLKDVQGALCEDGAKGGRQAELDQTLQMSHFLSFRFLPSLFQCAAVDQGEASVQITKQSLNTQILNRLNTVCYASST